MTRPSIGARCALAGTLLAAALLAPSLAPKAALSSTSPRPPSVTTGALPLVSTSAATLKGIVNPHGGETVYAFQFGATTGYGAQTAPVSIGSATGEIKVSQTISGLQPYTTYHFRLIATNPSGTTDGQDAVFTTKQVPLTFQLSVSPNPDIFGMPLSVSGTLSGTGAAGRQIVLQADPFPYLAGFKTVGAPQVTDPNGRFSFSLAQLSATSLLRVASADSPIVRSSPLSERVAVRVSLHLRSTGRSGFVRMYGTVTPAEVGVRIGFQLMRPALAPLTVAGTVAKRLSANAARFSRVVHIRRGGLYRAFVQVLHGKLVSGYSRSLRIR